MQLLCAAPASGATVTVCTRPLNLIYEGLFLHCYLDIAKLTSGYDKYSGLHIEDNPYDPKKKCVNVPLGITVTAKKLLDAVRSAQISNTWDSDDYKVIGRNCCHYVNIVLLAAGSKGVEYYFPGAKLLG